MQHQALADRVLPRHQIEFARTPTPPSLFHAVAPRKGCPSAELFPPPGKLSSERTLAAREDFVRHAIELAVSAFRLISSPFFLYSLLGIHTHTHKTEAVNLSRGGKTEEGQIEITERPHAGHVKCQSLVPKRRRHAPDRSRYAAQLSRGPLTRLPRRNKKNNHPTPRGRKLVHFGRVAQNVQAAQ